MNCADPHRKIMFPTPCYQPNLHGMGVEVNLKVTFCCSLHEICASAERNHVSKPTSLWGSVGCWG